MVTGKAALTAGPAIVLCFFIASFACMLSAFAYAEFAARAPISGSAYTFAYVTLGEFTAWFVGWNLTLEYAISAAAVARGWASNFGAFFDGIGAPLPDFLYQANVEFTKLSPLSLVVCIFCMTILLLGVKESATVNKITTVVNVCLILFIVILGSFHVSSENWTATPLPSQLPSGCSSGSHSGYFPCGLNGVLTGAAQVFFSYIGFDAVTTLAEEVRCAVHGTCRVNDVCTWVANIRCLIPGATFPLL